MLHRWRISAIGAALAVAMAACSGAGSSSDATAPPSPPTPGASVSGGPSGSVGPAPTDGSAGASPAASATIESFNEFVGSIDLLTREASIAGSWNVTFTLVRFESEGVDYRPYLPIGGIEEWTWTVTPRCASGPCDVRFEAQNRRLSGTFPSSLRWSPERAIYVSQGITALPQADCRDEAGSRIRDSYEVQQSLLIVVTESVRDGSADEATRLAGLRVDEGLPVAGVPESCGTFTEGWRMEAERPG